MNFKKAFSKVAVAATIGVGILGALTGAQADANTAASNAAAAPEETSTTQVVNPNADANHKPSTALQIITAPTIWKYRNGRRYWVPT